MANHSVSTLHKQGFTGAELQELAKEGLIWNVRPGIVQTTKSPSKWPKQYQAMWYNRKPLPA